MTGFFGKSYRYKERIIGVCETLNEGMWMVGHATTGGHRRMKKFPLCLKAEEAQARLDAFANARGLAEVRA